MIHSDKLRKEKLQTMKETGCYVPEAFTEGMTKDLEKERRRLQLETCEVSSFFASYCIKKQ